MALIIYQSFFYMKSLSQPKEGDYSSFFSTYLKLVTGDNYEEQMLNQLDSLLSVFHENTAEWVDRPYEEGKWTPKELIGHIVDTERIMTFRALCIARGEKLPLPGFDQDSYVLNSRFSDIPIHLLLDDFVAQRYSLISMTRLLPEDSLDKVGTANDGSITPRALLWIIPGHFAHHLKILQDRY